MQKNNVQNNGLALDNALERLTKQGASRRDVLRALAAGGVMSITGAGLLGASTGAYARAAAGKP